MKGLYITHIGLEKSASKEIEELIKKKSSIGTGVCVFECNEKDLCRLCYLGRAGIRVLELLDEFKFSSEEDLLKKVSKIKFDFLKDKSFVVRCLHTESNMTSIDIEPKIGEVILDKIAAKVDLNNPDYVVGVYLGGNTAYIGIDYAGYDLSKREYRIFLNPAAIKGSIAFGLLKMADYEEKDFMLDPYCNSGIIAIESALYATNRSPRFYKKEFAFLKFAKFDFAKEDKRIKEISGKICAYDYLQANVKSAEKNAKIAGVQKSISFSRIEAEWLDIKFEKGSVDKIITAPPQAFRTTDQKEAEKVYKELFYQAEFILKKKGCVVILVKNIDKVKEAAEKHKFKLADDAEIMSGKEKYHALRFIQSS